MGATVRPSDSAAVGNFRSPARGRRLPSSSWSSMTPATRRPRWADQRRDPVGRRSPRSRRNDRPDSLRTTTDTMGMSSDTMTLHHLQGGRRLRVHPVRRATPASSVGPSVRTTRSVSTTNASAFSMPVVIPQRGLHDGDEVTQAEIRSNRVDRGPAMTEPGRLILRLEALREAAE